MNASPKTRRGRMAATALALVALTLGVSRPAAARDVYKAFLDPAVPHHRAILSTLDRLETDPKNAGLHNDLACLIAWDGFWHDALREFETAADLDRKDSRPLFNAGLVQAWRGEWGGARRSFHAATGRDQGNWPAWWMLGFVEEQLDDVEAAVGAYKRSLRVDTSLFDVAVNPFAARTRLRGRVLLETYEKRMVRAALPADQQLAEPERIAGFFQRTKPPAAAKAAPPAPAEEESTSGPVVTTFSPTSGAGAGRTASSLSTTSSPPQLKTAPPRDVPEKSLEDRRRESGVRRVGTDVAPAPTGASMPSPRPIQPPQPRKTPVPGPGGDDE